jgi:hypothetical protein
MSVGMFENSLPILSTKQLQRNLVMVNQVKLTLLQAKVKKLLITAVLIQELNLTQLNKYII